MEKDARAPALVVAATVTTPVQFAGVKLDASALLLPAATTTTVPRVRASLMAVWLAVPHPPLPPSDILITRLGVGFSGTPGTVPPEAQVMPATMSEVQPPPVPSTRTCWTLTSGATPTTPIPLLPIALIVPATCVPCQLLLLQEVQSPGSDGSASRLVPSLAVATSSIMS